MQKRTADIQKKSAAKVKDLENKIKNAKALREKELKDAEDGVNKAKKKMEESSKKMKEKYQVDDLPQSRTFSFLMSYTLIVVVLLFYVHGKHLRLCRDGQLS